METALEILEESDIEKNMDALSDRIYRIQQTTVYIIEVFSIAIGIGFFCNLLATGLLSIETSYGMLLSLCSAGAIIIISVVSYRKIKGYFRGSNYTFMFFEYKVGKSHSRSTQDIARNLWKHVQPLLDWKDPLVSRFVGGWGEDQRFICITQKEKSDISSLSKHMRPVPEDATGIGALFEAEYGKLGEGKTPVSQAFQSHFDKLFDRHIPYHRTVSCKICVRLWVISRNSGFHVQVAVRVEVKKVLNPEADELVKDVSLAIRESISKLRETCVGLR